MSQGFLASLKLGSLITRILTDFSMGAKRRRSTAPKRLRLDDGWFEQPTSQWASDNTNGLADLGNSVSAVDPDGRLAGNDDGPSSSPPEGGSGGPTPQALMGINFVDEVRCIASA
jgi:hypothetical protein